MIRRAGKRIAAAAAEGNSLGLKFIAEKAFPVELARRNPSVLDAAFSRSF